MNRVPTEHRTPGNGIEIDLDRDMRVQVLPQPEDDEIKRPGSKWWIASGVFLLVLALYVLTNPGRIDIIDGQTRFDVAYNWILSGRPVLEDPWIGPYMGVPGRDGLRYSYYGAPASVFSMPLVWLGLSTSGSEIQPTQFLFALTSSVFGAGIAFFLFLFYLELGVTTRRALAWTMVSSFSTFIWPASNTTFDNAQHAFFALAALYFGFLGARRKSSAYAVLGGLMAGVLVLYQEYFLLIIPALALSTLEWKSPRGGFEPALRSGRPSMVGRIASAGKETIQATWASVRRAWDGPGEERSSCLRYVAFLAAVSIGVVLSLAYNDLRFGSWLEDGKMKSITAHAYPLFGNPLAGLLTLLVSPGKSIVLYSPPIVLAILGMTALWRCHQEIAKAVLLASLLLVSFLSCICFVGGDWCWGPRYLAVLTPLWALAFPFVPLHRVRRDLVVAIVGLGLLVQFMALSVENQRFFCEKGFRDYFWADDPWVYFKHSALGTRVGETMSLSDGLPPTAVLFNSIPITEWYTYTPLGGPDRRLRADWVRNFKIYFLPRPWPLWMSYLPHDVRPVNLDAWLVGLLSMATLGSGMICRELQTRKRQ